MEQSPCENLKTSAPLKEKTSSCFECGRTGRGRKHGSRRTSGEWPHWQLISQVLICWILFPKQFDNSPVGFMNLQQTHLTWVAAKGPSTWLWDGYVAAVRYQCLGRVIFTLRDCKPHWHPNPIPSHGVKKLHSPDLRVFWCCGRWRALLFQSDDHHGFACKKGNNFGTPRAAAKFMVVYFITPLLLRKQRRNSWQDE